MDVWRRLALAGAGGGSGTGHGVFLHRQRRTGLAGGDRPGDNLYNASILAIDAYTGEYRWHYQEVHHDIWDYDASNPVVLFDIDIDGRMRKGIVEVGKTGFAYILDRETGEPLIGIEERAVPQEPRQATAATQPYPIGEPVIPRRCPSRRLVMSSSTRAVSSPRSTAPSRC